MLSYLLMQIIREDYRNDPVRVQSQLFKSLDPTNMLLPYSIMGLLSTISQLIICYLGNTLNRNTSTPTKMDNRKPVQGLWPIIGSRGRLNEVYNNQESLIQMNPPDQQPSSPQARQREYKRYKYCCRKCKHTEKGKKSCVCVVPLSQRRTNLTEIGCQTCKCKGCSIEDYISRGEDPEYRPARNEKRQSVESEVNLCCKKCSSSKNHKRCVCQLPKNRRRNKISSKGCKLCGCFGCNPKEESSGSSSSPSRDKSESSQDEKLVYNELQYNFNNIDRSLIGRVVIVEYSLNPAMIGLGIPQRTPSYILGKPL